MIKSYIFILIAFLALNSCQKNKEELDKIKQELAEKEKVHQQRMNVGKQKRLNEFNEQLQMLPSALAKAEAHLNDVNGFKLLRSSSTKEKEVNAAYKQLNEIRTYGEKLKNEIAELEYHKTFDFQKTPEGLMSYIFESIKAREFTNFRYLCDPYAENDSDVNAFCYVEILSKESKEELFNNFKNARLIGDTIVNGDRAAVEFAYGPYTDKLESMELINRNGFWYLLSF